MPLSYFRRPLFWLLVLYICVLAAWPVRRAPREGQSRLAWRASVDIEAVVASPLKEDHGGQKVLARAKGPEDFGLMLVYLPRGDPANGAQRPGQTILFHGRLRPPRPARNPGDFDERAFLSHKGVAWIMNAESYERMPDAVAWRWLPFYWAESVRRSMEDCFKRLFSNDEAHVLSGITLGYKGALDRGLNRAVQDAGVMHLLVPSGAKTAFVLMGTSLLSSCLGLALPARFALAALVGGFYTLMVGAEPPYLRAYLGALALYGGLLLDREAGAFQATLLSAWLILIFDPRALHSVGFQMTYLAMAGLLTAMPTVNRAFPRAWPPWFRRLGAMAAVTSIVQLMLWPIFANVFGRGSIVGVLTNLILVPASGVLMAGGFAVWAASLAAQGPALAFLAAAESRLLRLFCWLCVKAAQLPWAAVELSPMSRPAVLAYYLLAFSALVLPRRRASAALALCGVLVWTAGACAQRLCAPPLRVLYLRLPKSRAALVTIRGRENWLIDAGGPAGTVVKALRARHVARLDKVLLTAKDPGSRAALPKVKSGFSVAAVVESPGPGTLCEKEVCFDFNPPRVRRGNVEFGIIAKLLRKSAVEVVTDGFTVKIRPAR